MSNSPDSHKEALMERIRSLDSISDRAERAYEIAQLSGASEEEETIIIDEFWEALMGEDDH